MALRSSYNTYDDVSRSKSVRGGESNHLELSESTFTATYETLNPGSGVYSEVTAQYAPQVQVRTKPFIINNTLHIPQAKPRLLKINKSTVLAV